MLVSPDTWLNIAFSVLFLFGFSQLIALLQSTMKKRHDQMFILTIKKKKLDIHSLFQNRKKFFVCTGIFCFMLDSVMWAERSVRNKRSGNSFCRFLLAFWTAVPSSAYPASYWTHGRFLNKALVLGLLKVTWGADQCRQLIFRDWSVRCCGNSGYFTASFFFFFFSIFLSECSLLCFCAMLSENWCVTRFICCVCERINLRAFT